MKKQLALMGQIVTVNAQLKRHVEYDKQGTKITWKPEPMFAPRAGWVVGFRTVQEGEIEPHRHSDYEYSDEPNYLSIKNTIPVVLVVFWPTMKPVIVPLDAYVLGGVPVSPSRKAYQEFATRYPEQAEDFCQMMREEAEKMDRDEHGRFKKIKVV